MASAITTSGCHGRLASDESKEFPRQYQEKAPSAGVGPLGYYLPPFAFSYMQVLQ
jgi:hypothetical protein